MAFYNSDSVINGISVRITGSQVQQDGVIATELSPREIKMTALTAYSFAYRNTLRLYAHHE